MLGEMKEVERLVKIIGERKDTKQCGHKWNNNVMLKEAKNNALEKSLGIIVNIKRTSQIDRKTGLLEL